MNARRTVSLGTLLPDWLADVRLTPQTAKELRALLPLALVTTLLGVLMLPLVAVVVSWHNDAHSVFMVIVALGYSVGLVALGATAFGHEYVHRTVGLLLIQPLSREELLRSKLRVLLPVLVVSALPGLGAFLIAQDGGVLLLWLAALLSSILVAPWVTLLCRSTLAGVVFTFALPYLLFILVNVLAEFVWTASESVRLAWSAGLVIGHWTLGGLLGWRKFLRLEAKHGGGSELSMPWVLTRQGRAATGEPAPPIAPAPLLRNVPAREIRVVRSATWMLAKKELRLQPFAWWGAGVFAVLWFGQAWLIWRQEHAGEEFLGLTAGCYMLFMPLLIGCLTCAEERQMGTHAWQLTLPVAVAGQWWIKTAVAIALALVLGLALPLTLAVAMPFPTLAIDEIGPVAGWAGAIVVVTILGLYASSVSQQSMMALLFGLALAVILPPVLIGFTILISSSLLTALVGSADLTRETAGGSPEAALFYGLPVVVLVLAWLGSRNFRQPVVSQADRFGQLLVIALVVLLAGILAGIFAAVPSYLHAEAAAQAWADETARQQRQPQVTPLGPMDAAFARRYGLQRTPSPTNTAERFGLQAMVRYGLIPAEFALSNSASPAPPGNQPPADTSTTTK